jgi:methylmalonyl-CoA/ethylmalonyl-CoA epimerase
MINNFEFHHIGYAVYSINDTADLYKFLGFTSTDIVYDAVQNCRIAFLRKENLPLIELVEPVNEDSPVYNYLGKSGVTPYHICYEVKDIINAINELKKHKFRKLFDPVHAVALGNARIVYLYNAKFGLIELVDFSL